MTMSVPGQIAVVSALPGVPAVLAAAGAGDGGHRRPPAALLANQSVGVIVRPDRSGAARVRIVGGTSEQRRPVRDVIARMDAPPRIMPRPAITTAVLDCEGTSTDVATPAAACRHLSRDWMRYLPPLEAVCSSPMISTVQISGTFHGIPVERSSQGGTGVDLTRRRRLLGVAEPS